MTSKIKQRHTTRNGSADTQASAEQPEIVQAAPSPNVQRVDRTRVVGPPADAVTPNPDKLDLHLETVRYVTLAAGSVMRMGVWVPCPLPQYKGLSVLFRTNNETKVRQTRPDYIEPHALRQHRRELASVDRELEATPDDELLVERRIDLMAEALRLQNDYAQEYHTKQCAWLARYVIGFDGWLATDIAEPTPDDPTSYVPLWTEAEDLYTWLLGDGYRTALALSAKNS